MNSNWSMFADPRVRAYNEHRDQGRPVWQAAVMAALTGAHAQKAEHARRARLNATMPGPPDLAAAFAVFSWLRAHGRTPAEAARMTGLGRLQTPRPAVPHDRPAPPAGAAITRPAAASPDTVRAVSPPGGATA
jgi:hypothetical protein